MHDVPNVPQHLDSVQINGSDEITTNINTSLSDDNQIGKNKMFNTTKMTTVTPKLEITLENNNNSNNLQIFL